MMAHVHQDYKIAFICIICLLATAITWLLASVF
jgi:hypothetical protein